jgi:MFS family permease
LNESVKRKKAMAVLFTGVGFSATGFLAMVTVIPLVAEDLLGSARWSGLPSAILTGGTAFGTSWLAATMSRHGRRRGLLLGYMTAATGAVLAAFAAASSQFVLLCGAMFCLGAGYGASYLSRYAGADLFEPARRASAIGLVIWAGTVGAVLGPNLLEPTRRAAATIGMPEVMAPFLLAGFAFAGAWIVLYALLPAFGPVGSSSRERGATLSQLTVRARIALVALVVGHAVMVLVMTMTPIHIRSAGHGLEAVGPVISSHAFGMFALSPLSGFLSDRLGRIPLILAAGVLLAASSLLAAIAGGNTSVLAIVLFLLGLGWNFGFVSGSALLTESVPEHARIKIQGFADALVWTSAALSGVTSGLLLSAFGYATLTRLAACLALVPATLVLLHRKAAVAEVRAPAVSP